MNDSERETQATGFAVFEFLPLLAGFIEAMQINHASVQDRIHRSMATTTCRYPGSRRTRSAMLLLTAREAIQQKLLDHLPWELFKNICQRGWRAPTIPNH